MRAVVIEDLDAIIADKSIPWREFEGKSVLISGANGFLPAYIVETLLHLKTRGVINNITVLALVRNLDKARAKFIHHADNPALVFIHQDVSRSLQYDGRIDYLVHAASQASPKYYGIDPVGTMSANTLGTFHMLEAAKKHGVKSMLNFSSSEIYGTTDHRQIAESDYGYIDLSNVRSCYAESKRAGEVLCVSYCHQFSVPVKTVRPFHTYGPGMSPDDGRVFADFVFNVVRNQDIVMHSDGSAVRAFLYLQDAARAFFTILLNGANGESYNMGNPAEAVSIRRLAEILTRLFPEKHLGIRCESVSTNYMPSPVAGNLPDITKLQGLGWNPTISIAEGFKRTIESYL